MPSIAEENRKKTTIKDVARLAGVAPSTVSRVVAGSSRISPQTHRRVRQAMEDLNYHPNAIARSLARRSTGIIGLNISRPAEQAFANPFFAEVIRGIGSVLQKKGFNLLLSSSDTEREERQTCLGLLRENRVDGVILTSSRAGDRLIKELKKERHPFVLIGRVIDGDDVNWVNNDNEAVGAMAVRHLYDLGHRRIAIINGPREFVVSIDRENGYRRALEERGLRVDPGMVQNGRFTQDEGYRAMERLLQVRPHPTAVFAADDAMALGALQCLNKHGLRVPTDISLIGVNDDPIAAHVQPPLTTVRIPIFELGAVAARMIVELVEGELDVSQRVILPSCLVVRESTAGPAR